jgi:hypothetical protein
MIREYKPEQVDGAVQNLVSCEPDDGSEVSARVEPGEDTGFAGTRFAVSVDRAVMSRNAADRERPVHSPRKFKPPSRKRTATGRLHDFLRLQSGYIPLPNEGRPFEFRPVWCHPDDWARPWHATPRCVSGEAAHDWTEVDGIYTCRACGLCGDSVRSENPYCTSPRFTAKQNRYNFMNHLDRHLKPLTENLTVEECRRVRGTFPRVYRVFFKIYPNRKNFMSYGFVLRKIMVREGLERYVSLVPTIKTPSKVRESEEAWRRICERLRL